MANQNKAKQNTKGSNWKQADYGNKFTGKDIKQLSSQGYTGNQILKIASAALQMDRWKPDSKSISRTDMLLGKVNQEYLNPETKTGYIKGQGRQFALYPINGKPQQVLLAWNSLGDSYRANPLSRYRLDNILSLATARPGAYKDTGKKWFVPPSMRNATTFGSTAAPVAQVVPTEVAEVAEAAGEQLPMEGMGGDAPMEDVAPENPMSSQSGYSSALASWAAGWRGAKSSRRKLGISAQGTASQRIAPSAQLVAV